MTFQHSLPCHIKCIFYQAIFIRPWHVSNDSNGLTMLSTMLCLSQSCNKMFGNASMGAVISWFYQTKFLLVYLLRDFILKSHVNEGDGFLLPQWKCYVVCQKGVKSILSNDLILLHINCLPILKKFFRNIRIILSKVNIHQSCHVLSHSRN